jgi:hypothetical protein
MGRCRGELSHRANPVSSVYYTYICFITHPKANIKQRARTRHGYSERMRSRDAVQRTGKSSLGRALTAVIIHV